MADAAAVFLEAFRNGLRPDPALTVSEWSNTFRYLPQEAAAEPGRYRIDRTPYLKEIVDGLSKDDPTEEIVVMKGAQVGATEAGNNWVGYTIHQAPAPMLLVLPTLDLAKRASKQRLAPMIKATPVLTEKVMAARARDSGNTLLAKEFPGGYLIIAGANSGAGLRSMPAKNVMLDEVDAYPSSVAGEGSPVALARKRTATFSRRKIFLVSTPLLKHTSLIEAEFESTDQRRFFVPCPFCDHFQTIDWKNLKWLNHENGRPDLKTVHLECEGCSGEIKNHHKQAMLERGEWRATAPDTSEGKRRGYHISALYSPVGWFSWEMAVRDFDAALGDDTLMQAFLNTTLGETYEVKAEDAVPWEELWHRRESYPMGVVPAEACLLTAAADVQKDRIEVLLIGWRKKEAWVVDHKVLPGDTAKEEPWLALDELLAAPVPHAGGALMPIRALMIDSGFNTVHVYEWARRQSARQVYAIKGRDDYPMPIGAPKTLDITSKGKKIRRGIRLWPVGTNMLKSSVYSRLRLKVPTETELKERGMPPRFLHLPQVSEEFCKQATAEQLKIVKKRNGQVKYEWVKIYAANEILDLLVYNEAAWHAVGAGRWNDDQWARLADEVGAAGAVDPPPPAPADGGDPPPAGGRARAASAAVAAGACRPPAAPAAGQA
jgi:phage terminase large subunit GpA-like protein